MTMERYQDLRGKGFHQVVVGKLIELYFDVLADTAAHEKESHDN